MTDASTEGRPTGVIEEEASPHVSYTTQVGLGSKRHDPSPVHAPLSNGIQFMGIYAEYDQHISPWQQNIRKISLLFPGQGNRPSLMAGSCSEPVKSFRKSFHKRANFIKGPGKAICPPEFLIQILMDPVYAKQLDHLLDKMTLIQEVDNHM